MTVRNNYPKIKILIGNAEFRDPEFSAFCCKINSFRRFGGFFFDQISIEPADRDIVPENQYAIVFNGQKRTNHAIGRFSDLFDRVSREMIECDETNFQCVRYFTSHQLWKYEDAATYMYTDLKLIDQYAQELSQLPFGKVTEINAHNCYLLCYARMILVKLQSYIEKFSISVYQVNLKNLFFAVRTSILRYPEIPFFQKILARLYELKRDNEEVDRAYEKYIRELNFCLYDNVSADVSSAYYFLGRYKEHRIMDELNLHQVSDIRYYNNDRRAMEEIVSCYRKSLAANPDNYRAKYKMVMLRGISTLIEDGQSWKSLFLIIDQHEKQMDISPTLFLYKYKVLYQIAEEYRANDKKEQAMEFFDYAEYQIDTRMYNYLYLTHGSKQVLRLTKAVKIHLDFARLYLQMAQLYVQMNSSDENNEQLHLYLQKYRELEA